MSTSIYTSERLAQLTAAQPLNWEKCQQFASAWGTSPRSVQTKSSIMGLEYAKKAAKPKAARDTGPTKAAYLVAIREALALPQRSGDLTKAELERVLESIS